MTKNIITDAYCLRDIGANWRKDNGYPVSVVKMSNGRYAIYKSRFSDTGYLTYDSLEEMKQDFKLARANGDNV